MTLSFRGIQHVVAHPANANSKTLGMLRYLNWQFNKRFLRLFNSFEFHGFKFPVFSDSHSQSAAYYCNGLPDWWEMQFIKDYLREGDNFLDVGANVGVYTLFAASIVKASGHIDAFEPNQLPAERLQQALKLNSLESIVSVFRSAVSNSDGTIEFTFAKDDCQSHVRNQCDSTEHCMSIPAVRLDSVVTNRKFAMGKMDIEGHEPMALEGASRMLKDGNPRVLQVEVAGYSKLFGVTTAELVTQLLQYQYRCFCYDPITKTLSDASKPWERALNNVLAIHDSSMPFVKSRLTKAM